jgi:hypothetical protein
MAAPFIARQIERIARPLATAREFLHQRHIALLKRHVVPALANHPPRRFQDMPVTVALLLGHTGLDMGLWTARSLDHHSGRNWRYLFIDDGTLTDADIARATRALVHLRVLRKQESDARIATLLGSRSTLLRAMTVHPIFRRPLALALYDEPIIAIDTDVLFFAPPHQIMEWANSGSRHGMFMQDPITFYYPSPPTLDQWLQKPVLRHVNGGLVLLPPRWLDLDLTERLFVDHFDAPDRTWHIEQSLLAINLTQTGAQPLSHEHELSFHPTRRKFCVARHYVGDGRARDYFYTEGISELSRFLLN